jgi:outer membrane lipoprotein carrier protein
MKNVIVPVLALLLATAAPSFADEPPKAPATTAADPARTQEIVEKVQAFYNTSQTFRADFSQKFWVKAYNKEKTSSGTVLFGKPGKMSWTYTAPAGNRVVSDGSVLKVYEAENKQMFEQNVDKSQYPAALSFLTGTGKLTDSFIFELFEGEKMGFKDGWVLVGVPKTANAPYAKVLFYVDKASSQVRRVMIIDQQGNRNRFDFSNPKVNETVKPENFQFTPPSGTTIVKQ